MAFTNLFMRKYLLYIFGMMLFSAARAQSTRKLTQQIIDTLSRQQGVFAVAFKDLQTGKTIFYNEHEIFHAASTMKTPVLLEAYHQAAEGKFAITDSITIINQFQSIADTSHFSLSATDDSELDLYKHIGEKARIYDLIYTMIIRSSNLATNIMIDKLGALNVMKTLHGMGLSEIKVLRGVEDGKAFEKGLNNVVSAYDLSMLFEKIAGGKAVNQAASAAMIKILLDQEFNDIIPARLPAGVKVAHKTGFITGIHHDSGIVFLPNGKKYILVLLSKNLVDDKAGIAAMASVSEMIYQYEQHLQMSKEQKK